jgi:hypothetical protein
MAMATLAIDICICLLLHGPIELFVKYVQKSKLRENFIKTGVSSSQGAKRILVVVLR